MSVIHVFVTKRLLASRVVLSIRHPNDNPQELHVGSGLDTLKGGLEFAFANNFNFL